MCTSNIVPERIRAKDWASTHKPSTAPPPEQARQGPTTRPGPPWGRAAWCRARGTGSGRAWGSPRCPSRSQTPRRGPPAAAGAQAQRGGGARLRGGNTPRAYRGCARGCAYTGATGDWVGLRPHNEYQNSVHTRAGVSWADNATHQDLLECRVVGDDAVVHHHKLSGGVRHLGRAERARPAGRRAGGGRWGSGALGVAPLARTRRGRL